MKKFTLLLRYHQEKLLFSNQLFLPEKVGFSSTLWGPINLQAPIQASALIQGIEVKHYCCFLPGLVKFCLIVGFFLAQIERAPFPYHFCCCCCPNAAKKDNNSPKQPAQLHDPVSTWPRLRHQPDWKELFCHEIFPHGFFPVPISVLRIFCQELRTQ